MALLIHVLEKIKVFDIIPFLLKGYSSIKKFFNKRVISFLKRIIDKAHSLRGPPIVISVRIYKKEAQEE